MKQLIQVVGVSCLLFAGACKKKAADAGGSGGSETAGSAMAGSGSAAAGSGSAVAMTGSGSAMAGSGSAMAGSGSAMAGSGSAAPAGGNAAACVEGAYKDPAGRYCVKLPAGYAPPAIKLGDSQEIFNSSDGTAVTISVYKQSMMSWDNMKYTAAQETEGNKPSEKVDLDGGNAYWVKIHLVGSKQSRVDYAIKVGDTYVMDCTLLWSDKTPPKPEDACKTLRSML